jgi:hypothetical protein
MDPLDIHGSIHGSMNVDVPLGSMDVDVTNIHGYPSSDFTGRSPNALSFYLPVPRSLLRDSDHHLINGSSLCSRASLSISDPTFSSELNTGVLRVRSTEGTLQFRRQKEQPSQRAAFSLPR